jgi:ABC-type lipoprotein export system ATPase subunit
MEKRIHSHIKILLDEYNLNDDYDKNTRAVLIASFNKESLYWILLLFNKILQKNPNYMSTFIIILVLIYGLNIFSQKHLYKKRNILLQKLNNANIDYFQNKLLHMPKDELLNFDFNRYFDTLTSIRKDFDSYIITQKIKKDIPMKFITLFVIGINTQNPLLFVLIPIFYFISIILHNKNNEKTSEVVDDIYENENVIKKYMINSKLFIVNNELNTEYVLEQVKELSKNNYKLNYMNAKVDTRIDILIFVIILVNFVFRYNKIKIEDFLVYFYFIYDIEFLSEIMSVYNSGKKKYNDFNVKLNILYSVEKNGLITKPTEEKTENSISSISIRDIKSDNPTLDLHFQTPLEIVKGKPLLVDGISGSGKSTLFYILKGIVKPVSATISPELEVISKCSYISLPKHRSIFSGDIYDIISNYEKNPDTNRISMCIKMFELEKALKLKDINNTNNNANNNTNKYINIETMSAGEQTRLLLARTVYNVYKNNYDILLFDEIDENLNEELSIYVCKTLTDIFKDKIILYITHNDKVKTLFQNRINIKNGGLV